MIETTRLKLAKRSSKLTRSIQKQSHEKKVGWNGSQSSSIVTDHKRRITRPEEKDNFSSPVWSVRFRHPSIRLSLNRLAATGSKGWCTVLLTHGVSFGCWYYEVTIKNAVEKQKISQENEQLQQSIQIGNRGGKTYAPQNITRKTKIIEPHIRIGWSCRYSRYDLPIGTDKFSFCLRDVDCSIVQQSRRYKYAPHVGQLKPGDVIGCCLTLGPEKHILQDPTSRPELHPFIESGLLCNPATPPPLIINTGSFAEFLLNGKSLGPIHDFHIYCGTYHPAVALYMEAQCVVNSGPQFKYSPPEITSEAKVLTGFTEYKAAAYLPAPPF